jgi:hypothetical protein
MEGERKERFRLGQVPGSKSDADRLTEGENETAGMSRLPPSILAEQSPDAAGEDVQRLGADLARALQDGGYHPIIIFGTNFSGKTSLLLSLFATLTSEPKLEAGLILCDPILGTTSGIGRRLHEEAVHTFDVKTQAFIEGEKIPKTNVSLPFFIPVEFRPAGKPAVRFAFLESNGEWYRPLREKGKSLGSASRLYPELKSEIEDFIASYQGALSFIYLTPYTQSEVYVDRDNPTDNDEVLNASLAITGVLRSYDRIRANHRAQDRHLMLVSKWDAHSARSSNRAEGIEEDRDILAEFTQRRYSQAIAAYQGINVPGENRQLNAYCSGIINERGLLQLRQDDDARAVILGYPIRLWTWLYHNALAAADYPRYPPFPEPPRSPFFVRLFRNLLDRVSGG